jgi:tetratricopeptide (TPR) repeat protein
VNKWVFHFALPALLGILPLACRRPAPPVAPPASQPSASQPATAASAPGQAPAVGTAKPPKPFFVAVGDYLSTHPRMPRPRDSWQSRLVAAVNELRNDPRAQMAAGDRALAVGMNQQAVTCFEQAVSLAPNNADALQGLAIALTVARQNERALPIYQRIIELDGSNTTARFNYAVTLMRLDRLPEARKQYEDLLARDGDYFRARYNLAVIFQSQGKLSQARDAWAQAMKHADKMAAPDAAVGWSHYGQVLYELGEASESADAYSEAAKLDSDNPAAWLNYASAARVAGQFGHAMVAARRAMKLAPREPVIWAKIGDLMLDLHRQTGKNEYLTEAIKAWKISLALNPKQPRLSEYLTTYEKAR